MTTPSNDDKSNDAPAYPCLVTMALAYLIERLHPNNPREVTAEGRQQLREQSDALGNLDPITFNVRSSYVIHGNQRVIVYHERGDVNTPVWCVDLDEAQERRALVALNNHVGAFDPEKLRQIMESAMADSDDPLEAAKLAGFKPGELEAILASANQGGGGGGGGDGPEQTIKVFEGEQIIESAFEWYRARDFPYRKLPLHVCMQQVNLLANTPTEAMMNSDTGYHVADTFHPHRFHGYAEGMKSPFEAFNDDKMLRKAITLTWENAGRIGDEYISLLSLVSGTQACSNFRPAFAMMLYREFCQPEDTVLDTSTGYGGRLLGFIASGVKGKYIGIDPSLKTHEGNVTMAAALGFAKHVQLINQPAEDVKVGSMAGKVDFAFTSPPYFTKERYAEETTQSFDRYPEIKLWVKGFLVPMLKLQFKALKPGKFSVVNIADVQIGKTVHPLGQLCEKSAAEVGFELSDIRNYPLSGHSFGKNLEDQERTEPVFVFQKPEA